MNHRYLRLARLAAYGVGAALPLLFAGLQSGCTSAPAYSGPVSAHFDGKIFRNTVSADKGLVDILKLSIAYPLNKQPWPEWRDNPPRTTVLNAEENDVIAVTVINHATALIQVDGINILTDPIYAERASPFNFAGPKRVHDPAIAFDDLPPIDLVLVSHNHYDALDVPTLIALKDRGHNGTAPLVLVGLGNGALLEQHGVNRFTELDWGQQVTVGGLEVEFVECRHRSGRGLTDHMQTLWGAFVVSSSKGKIYFGGDSGYGPHYVETRAKHGDFELALIPIGAYEPRWFMAAVHLSPAEAVEAHLDLRSTQSVGIHHGTFQLTYEAIDAPKAELMAALGRRGVDPETFTVLPFGETLRID